MSRISENIRKITKAWGGKTTGNGISDALSDLYNNLPFGTKTEMVEILPEQSVMQIDEEGQLLYLIKAGFTIENGKEYEAVVDGVSYDVIGMSDRGIYAVTDTGNLDTATVYFVCDPSGVAFPIPEGYGSVAMFPNGTANTRVAIYEEQEVVTQLPAKFRGFGDVNEFVEIYNIQNARGVGSSFFPSSDIGCKKENGAYVLVEGVKYKAVFNIGEAIEKSFEFVAKKDSYGVYIGFEDVTATQPFKFYYFATNANELIWYYNAVGENYRLTVNLYEEQIVPHPIDIKYLPIEELKKALGLA